MKKSNNQQIMRESWEEEFNKEFTYGGKTGIIALKTENAMVVKSFIRNLLEEQKQSVLEDLAKKVEGMVDEDGSKVLEDWQMEYVTSLLESLKEEK